MASPRRAIPARMRAAVITAPRTCELRTVETPHPAADQVVVELEGCGVCGSNLPRWDGRPWFEYPAPPGSPGHEGWGRVVGCGPDVQRLAIGDRVAFLSERAFAEYDVTAEATALVLPAGLDGSDVPGEALGCAMNVLDVGCNAGYYAFEMKRRGAAHVVAIDSDPRYLAQARLAAEVLGHRIELRELDVYRVAELGTKFDLVIFMGVLYHLRHPLLALDLLYDHAVADRLLFQSMLRGPAEVPIVEPDYRFEETAVFERPGHPAMYFVEQRYAGDWTNWWIPNRAGIEAMLRSAGFAIETRAEDEVYLCRRGPRRSAESETTP